MAVPHVCSSSKVFPGPFERGALSSPRTRQSGSPALGEAVVMVAGDALQWSVACLGVTGLAPET